MNAKTQPAPIESLLGDILGTPGSSAPRRREIRALASQFEDISRRDYERQLRNHFSQREMRSVVAAMEMSVPALNRKAFSETDTGWLRRLAARLEVDVKTLGFGREREDLRGFYVPAVRAMDHPMIWLNTAHHRVAVASTFWHELGHHILHRLGEKAEPLTLMYGDDYKAHMSDLSELTADILLVLAVYPKAAAARLFGRFLKAGQSPSAYDLAVGSQRYLHKLAGFEFEPDAPQAENLHYLAGMIHYAKLRWALWVEYRL
jgi:hypothetical protein